MNDHDDTPTVVSPLTESEARMPFKISSEIDTFRYWAFISYSHRDKKWGDWLHRALESYRVPKRIAGQAIRDGVRPKRIFPIFRDREELAASADTC
jgi:hypothetical protein